ncbi:DNA-directed RNA polymerase II subunit rpb3 [Theileria parva strain Muguga]|uniref:DNA-directed RNA polymerase II, putative n=1 Tax=Theileria parva TaxID=5875 RepID=Q4N9T5_THEPA|nr:DNA-directed RNA polymerase II subunit rpb3 [Theileria parva strain Muguga]EAN33273.1 DNA-directed RNA polymerase II subunit rpb3 [Theileria parva strain Muguga]|eukprot:XP_765556.1 DNA-directed RNA polymerase II [Theileria parva strain Muguga]
MDWAPRQIKPSIEIVDLRKDRMDFILLNSDVSTANAIRRVILSEIPSLAIEIVTVLENTSVLHDEYISHRLGLLPIDSTLASEFEFRDRCQCTDKCAKCTVDYTLDVSCKDSDSRVVTHFDIVPDDTHSKSIYGKNLPMPIPRADVTNFNGATDGIPIVKLKRGHSINMKLTASKGLGKFHAKWIVANVNYKMEPRFSFNSSLMEQLSSEEKAGIAASCPRNVFKYTGVRSEAPSFLGPSDKTFKLDAAGLHVVDKLACIYCDECINYCRELGHKDLIRIQPDESKFHFTIESTGAIPPEKILEIALVVLEKKLQDLQSNFTEAQSRTLGTTATAQHREGTRAPQPSTPYIDLD